MFLAVLKGFIIENQERHKTERLTGRADIAIVFWFVGETFRAKEWLLLRWVLSRVRM
jgi:hypothetical protein